MRYVILVAYDGTRFGGWQTQKNSITVQQILEKAAEETFGVKTAVVASGRTDSGVHASGQVCHFDADISVPAEKIADALNVRLPEDISVLKSAAAPPGFDANRSAKLKTYCYRIYCESRRNPLKDRYAVHVKPTPDFEKLQCILHIFEGEHDFKAYCASGSTAKTTVREIKRAEASRTFEDGAENIEIRVTGNGFLYNMVRTLVGTALGYARGAIDEARIRKSLSEGDRESVGKTMPAAGLTLENVDYGFDLFV